MAILTSRSMPVRAPKPPPPGAVPHAAIPSTARITSHALPKQTAPGLSQPIDFGSEGASSRSSRQEAFDLHDKPASQTPLFCGLFCFSLPYVGAHRLDQTARFSLMTATVAAPERFPTSLLYVRVKLVCDGTAMMMELEP